MSPKIKSLVRQLLPQGAIENLRFIIHEVPRAFGLYRARRAFMAAAGGGSFLDESELSRLHAQYQAPPDYGYDPDSLERRGADRAKQLLSLPGVEAAHSFLELGCWDGMVGLALQRRGKVATCIDGRMDGFDIRATAGGVALVQMDARALQFQDDSFDVVFSYDAFEHFASPEIVFREAIRVTKPGGYIYVEFGPLYFSAFGEHAYRSVTVPYCQFLFPKKVLSAFTTKHGLAPIDFDDVNGWPLERYRELWKLHSHELETLKYREGRNLAHIDLIRKHPSCFKSKSTHFDGFTVSSISALFRKR